MATPSESSEAHAGPPRLTPRLNILVVFEDLASSQHAQRMCDHLVRKFGTDFELVNQAWKFSLLAYAKLKALAAEEAALADLIILSAHGDADLPPEIKSWIESWLDAQTPRTLIALFDRYDALSGEPSPMRSYLEDVARRGNMTFLVPSDSRSASEPHRRAEQFTESGNIAFPCYLLEAKSPPVGSKPIIEFFRIPRNA